jgi:histidine phosphotransferase ChpT
MDDALRLAQLLCQRFCDEVTESIAALRGKMQVALRGGERSADALRTAVDVADALTRRMEMLREAWEGSPRPMGVQRLRGLAASLPGGDSLTIDVFGLGAEIALPPALGRIVLNALLVAAESLPRGGTISLGPAGGADLVVRITGPRAAWPAGLAEWLANESAAWAALAAPNRVAGPVLAIVAPQLGFRVSLLLPSGRVGRGPAPLLISPAAPS